MAHSLTRGRLACKISASNHLIVGVICIVTMAHSLTRGRLACKISASNHLIVGVIIITNETKDIHLEQGNLG